jgi:hypothetical protein
MPSKLKIKINFPKEGREITKISQGVPEGAPFFIPLGPQSWDVMVGNYHPSDLWAPQLVLSPWDLKSNVLCTGLQL